MKKTLYIIVLGLLGFVGFTRANVNSLNVAPSVQSAISGSLVTFTVTGNNGTGGAYLKYILPKTAVYDIVYQNANITPLNNALLSLGAEHDPIFSISANSNFSVTITAKVISNSRTIPMISIMANFSSDTQFFTILTSAIAQITPIADLAVTNVLTGLNPSFSGDNVSYYITLQNIGSTSATGITFISNFPIPRLAAPTATFNGIPHLYTFINYPQDFVWSGSYLSNLNPGQTITILLNAPMTQAFAVGTTFNQIAKTTTASPEYSTGNNSATATGVVQATADVRITKTLAPFTGFKAGDQVRYLITYGNSGGKTADNVIITDIVPVGITLPVTTFTLGTLPAGSGGTIIITGTLGSLFTSGQVFVNTANITTTSSEGSTGNNSAAATGVIQGIANVTVNIVANNLTRPQLDNAPYGAGPSTLIQAVNGDIVQLTITYANFGNATGANATIGLSGVQGFVSLGVYNSNIGTLQLNTTGMVIITGIVGPNNYISFTPTVRLHYNGNQLRTDSVIIQEPFVCGDGMLTRTEVCDTQGNLGVLYSGQVCENQQGVCVLRTQSIVNQACVNYQYTNTLGGMVTGQACVEAPLTLKSANCVTMTGSAPVNTSNGFDVALTCKGNNANATTPISIDCGNGTSILGSGTTFNGICNYSGSFVGNAQCKVGSDIANNDCRVPVSVTAGQCGALDALDGTIAIANENSDAESTFRCETANHSTAQTITIDCGNGTQHTTNNASVFEAGCEYTNVDTPQTYPVKCLVDGVSAPTCQENLIVDEATFGRCGDGEKQGYEKCDDGDYNGTSDSNCTIGCDIKGGSVAMVGCFNVGNTNLSVQKNEILPFWRTLDKEKNFVSTCNDTTINKIQKSSLQCNFKIYNGNGVVKDIILPCEKDTRENYAIFNYLRTIGKDRYSLTHAFGKYSTVLSDNEVNNRYGEYKLVLDEVQYKYCDGTEFVEGAPIKRVCEVNFTVTKPYLIQKSSFGLTPKTTTDLSINEFYDMNNQKLVTSTEMDKIMVIDANTYKGGSAISTMMDTFITKYSKLAVKYTTVESAEGNTITVYKVPSQDIVVFKGDGTLIYTDKGAKTNPFTVIVDGPNLTINGSIENTNAMFLVNKGTIKFAEPVTNRCAKTQVVKGIFVTKNNFIAGEDLTNNATDKEWCPYGGLDVQGILIGKGIEDLVNSRRSQLNHWFKIGSTSDAAIKAERRNEIFNGASVLIEYSPSLWSALPPGANEFTKALDVYKQ
ncbi:MAG: hypothetical protein WC606_03490 [Candidatus Absconditabacterales bacterium]